MNKAAKKYWQQYWSGHEPNASVSAWQFGAKADELAQLVIEGKKTATCSAHILYEMENEPIPQAGEYNIILNSDSQPVAMTKTTQVDILPMNEVSESFALAEGEGGYDDWWSNHQQFFITELNHKGLDFSPEMLLVCEQFILIDLL